MGPHSLASPPEYPVPTRMVIGTDPVKGAPTRRRVAYARFSRAFGIALRFCRCARSTMRIGAPSKP